MDQRDSHCPYSLPSEITAKPTVLGIVLMCSLFVSHGTLTFLRFIDCCVSRVVLEWLYAQQRGKKTLLSLTLICYCHLVGMAKIVRGSTFRRTTMKHRYLTIWLTYCISIAFYTVLVKNIYTPRVYERFIYTRVSTQYLSLCWLATFMNWDCILTRNELLLPFLAYMSIGWTLL